MAAPMIESSMSPLCRLGRPLFARFLVVTALALALPFAPPAWAFEGEEGAAPKPGEVASPIQTSGEQKHEVIARCGKGYLELVDGYKVLHVKGTPYEMGFQTGSLLKDDCKQLLHNLFEIKAKELTVDFMGMKLGPQHAISLIFKFQRPFIPQRYIEEMEGVADGAGVDRETVFIANSIPELFHCSGFALLPETTKDDSILHGRVLDYGVDWGLQDHAVLVIAEPDGYIPFANVTYAGFIGSVTGMNAEQISVGEMGGKGAGKWAGTPMSFLMRRVLEEAHSLDEAVAIFRDSPRTCEYYYVFADGETGTAVGMDGSADRFELIQPGAKHPRLPTPVPGTVLLSANTRYDNLCKLVRGIRDQDGKFTIEQAIRLMDAPVAMRSNLHNALFQPKEGKLWVANASKDEQPAWKQKYYYFDTKKLLSQSFPTEGKELPGPEKQSNQLSRSETSDTK